MKLIKQIITRVLMFAIPLAVMTTSLLLVVPAVQADPPVCTGTPLQVAECVAAQEKAAKKVKDGDSNVSCGLGTSGCATGLPAAEASQGSLTALLQVVFGILAVLSVVMIVIGGGLRYVIQAGNPQEMSKAKNAIIYATVGLVVAISGEAIVSFVLNKLTF